MFCSGYGFFPRAMGLLFIIALVGYTILSCRAHLNGPKEEAEEKNEAGTGIASLLALIVIGLLLLAGGSHFFINGAVQIARHFGVSELLIGLTLAAVGTSLPELASSLAALRHNESGLLIGNIIGSNMFNLFMVLGLTGTIKPFALAPGLLQRDLPVMLFLTVSLIPILQRNDGTKRRHGFFFLGIYIAYILSLV